MVNLISKVSERNSNFYSKSVNEVYQDRFIEIKTGRSLVSCD
jgi:hypothetical protein